MPRAVTPPALLPPTLLRTLSRRSDARGLAQLAGHGALIALTGTLVALAEPWWLRIPAMAVHGVALVFLFAPLHETVHRTAFASRWLNQAVSWPVGLVLMLPPTWFRHFHLAHHRFTQDPANDPELAAPKPTTFAGYVWRLTGIPFWLGQTAVLARLALGRTGGMAFLPATARDTAVAEARLFVGLYGAVAAAAIGLGTIAPLVFWLLPVALGQPALRAFLLAEHTGCAAGPDLTINTRTTLTRRSVRALAWNMPYHAEHHLYPSVPFHALPRLHDHVQAALGHVTLGYRRAHREIRAQLAPADGRGAIERRSR